jgi:hypothetical protein
MPPTVPPDWVYYLSGVLLLVGNVAAWIGSLFMLPGNWLIFALSAAAAYFLPPKENGLGIGWPLVVILGGLAFAGELLEFFGSAAKAKQFGASRRGIVLSLLGAITGGTVGAMVGAPFGIVGGVVLLLLAGAGGAFAGTYLGETWKGRPAQERWAISRAALLGRLSGTAGKLIVGTVMVCLTAIAMFYF